MRPPIVIVPVRWLPVLAENAKPIVRDPVPEPPEEDAEEEPPPAPKKKKKAKDEQREEDPIAKKEALPPVPTPAQRLTLAEVYKAAQEAFKV